MEHRKLEKRMLGKTGLEVSALGFGGAEIGFNGVAPDVVKEIIDEALEVGVDLFDTAAAYLESEVFLGKCLKGRREQVKLVTKCGALDGFSRSDWSKDGILKTVQQSLKNLQTDYLDVVLLHSCNALEFLWGEAARGLEEAKKHGYARFIGYSGDNAAALSAVESGLFDVLETSLNIADQEAIDLTLPIAKAKNMGVIIKRPIANAAWRYTELPKNDYHQEYWKRFQKLKYDFLSGDDAAETALRFTLSQPGVSVAIVGASKPGRFRDNAETVAKGPLPEAFIKSIRMHWDEVSEPTWVGQI